MFTSNVQLGYLLAMGLGQAVQTGLFCTPPRISERMDNQQILLHHLLQKYLDERDINFICQSEMLTSNVQLGYLLVMVGGKLFRLVYIAPGEAVQAGLSCPPLPAPPPKNLGQAVSSVNSYCTIFLEYLVVRNVNIISGKLKCLHPTSSFVTLVCGMCVGGIMIWQCLPTPRIKINHHTYLRLTVIL